MSDTDQLRTELSGTLVLPDSENYDDARSIWNGMIDKKPAMIARCENADDVAAAIKFARSEGMAVSIHGNGHNIAGSAICDDGLVIDVSSMSSVSIDPESRRVSVGPGASLGDLDAATGPENLAVPTGINSTTGIAGLTLGGGFGWLTRKYGMTIDSLVSVEMVTVEGDKIKASEEENSDLFWALRGGGGNFGVVTSFEFQAYPLEQVFAGVIAFSAEEAASFYRRYRDLSATFPDESTAWPVLRKAPPLPFLKEEDHGKLVVLLAFCHCGEMADGEALATELEKLGTPLGIHYGPQPLAAWQQAFDPLLTEGARNYWKSHNFTELSDGAFDTIIEFGNKLPTDESEIFLAQNGGAASRVASDATAFAHRDTSYILNVHCRWREPVDDERCMAWAREFFEATAPYASGGVYSNFMSADEVGRASTAYGENYERLASIKSKYDPENFFRNNTNIRPA